MARYIGPKCRLCRREGEKLFLKGTRCLTDRCGVSRRAYPPGQHGQSRRSKPSNYGLQLREKQKVKRIYGVLEQQFRHYFAIASKKTGVTGETLLQLLERRVDNVMFRAGLALNRTQGRQYVRHGLIFINGRKTTVPSFLVKTGDKITLKNNESFIKVIKSNLEITKDWQKSAWLSVDAKDLSIEVTKLPERSDIAFPIKEQLIVELYSK